MIQNLWKLIGNTPLIAIRYRYHNGPEQEVLVKCEQYNMTGSVKDRTALYILQKATEQGLLRPGMLIAEASSGNTGISMAAIGKALGNRVRIFTPDWLSPESSALIQSYGAAWQPVSERGGGIHGCIQQAELMDHMDDVFLPRQFENLYGIEAHEKTTGREIGYSLILENIKPAAFVAGAGTGGTVMGVGKYLSNVFPGIRIHPVSTQGHAGGGHRVPGISDGMMPGMLKPGALDHTLQVADGEAILMAQKIAAKLGMPVGISSGANLAAAIRLQQEFNGRPVVTVFPDDHKRYVHTDLFKTEPLREDYLTPVIEFTGQRVLAKV